MIKEWENDIPRWKTHKEMGLDATRKEDWDNYTTSLKCLGLRKDAGGDRIKWGGTEMEKQISTKEAYIVLMNKHPGHVPDYWFKLMWKVKVQVKMVILLWLIWKNKNLTWKNLQRKGW